MPTALPGYCVESQQPVVLELSTEVDIKDVVKISWSHIFLLEPDFRSRIRNYKVDPTKMRIRILKHLDDLLWLADIGTQSDRFASSSDNLRNDPFSLRSTLRIVDDHGGSSSAKFQCDAFADSATRAGDECNFAS